MRGLQHRWPGSERPALRGVDLELAPGERVALLGPNGAGKSTLIDHICGNLLADPALEVGGISVTRANLREVRKRVGVVQQETDDQLFMPTVIEDVAFGPLNAGIAPEEAERRSLAALAQVGAKALAGRTHADLSGGERRRVAIATVLSMEVQLLVLDEPSSNLDARGRRALAQLLRALPITQLVATHDLELARAACDRVIILDEGRVIADGPAPLILADLALLKRHGVA